MCGILGSISEKYRFGRADIESLAHRGPDDEGYFYENGVMFGHRRLSIVDLSENGHQPMFSEEGRYVLIYNGEIYNHEDIRKKLLAKGYTFRSTSDTETLLYGYAEYGCDIIQQLNGIFAFAIYDRDKQEVCMARDQFGIKPFYYYDNNGIFAFASELKVLKEIPEFDKSINPTALFYYLQMLYAPGELTPFHKVKKLMPGHYLLYNVVENSFVVEKYYDVEFDPETVVISEKEWIEKLENALLKAVHRQLMSDVPLGFFLSGGLDSSLIVAIAKKFLPGHKLKCFTIAADRNMQREGFTDDELYARKVAEYLKVDLEIVPGDIRILDSFDKMIWHLDEPQADPAPLNVYNICHGARLQGIKVLLGGTAGDDLFSGYRRHQAINFEKYLRLIPRPVTSLLQAGASTLSTSYPTFRRIRKIAREMNQSKAERFAGYFTWLPENEVMALFRDDVQQYLHQQMLPRSYWMQLLNSLHPATEDLNKLLYLELKTFLPDHNLNYTDKMGMAASVEIRVPYLDVELVSLACSMPIQLKMKASTTKYLLRKVAEKYLPSDVIYRQKTGFGAPVRRWIRNDLQPLLKEEFSFDALQTMKIFDANAIARLIENDKKGKVDAAYTIWALLAIQRWIKLFAL